MGADTLLWVLGSREGCSLSLVMDRAQAREGSAAPFPQMCHPLFSINPSLLWTPPNTHPLSLLQCWVSC